MTKDSRINIGVREAVQCFGMSKMTVKDEMVKGYNPYKKLVYVEFLEFLGRIAQEKYKDLEDL